MPVDTFRLTRRSSLGIRGWTFNVTKEMKIIPTILMTLAFSIFASVAEEEIDYAKLEPSTVSKAITKLFDDPLSDDADTYSSIIVNFSDASPNILISLNTNLLPWLENDKLPELALRLSSAYIAGNVAEQIKLGKAQDSPAEGVAAALKMYRKLRETSSLPKIPILERWEAMTPKEIVAEANAKSKKETQVQGRSATE